MLLGDLDLGSPSPGPSVHTQLFIAVVAANPFSHVFGLFSPQMPSTEAVT